MEKVSDRLASYLKNKGKGQTAFEKEAGLSRGYVKHASNNMGSKIRAKIKEQCPDLNIEWLLTGEGSMLTTGNNNQSIIAGGNVTDSNNRTIGVPDRSTAKEVKPYLREELVNVPYVPIDAKASFIESLYDNAYEVETCGVMAEDGEHLNETEYKVFQIDGDSMTPNIPDRAKVLARVIPDAKWEEASGVVFVVYGKTLTIKRILKNSLFDKKVLTLKADNPVHGQVDIERSEIRGMWQAVRIVSQRII